MPIYCDKDALGRPDDVFVIEDATMVMRDESGDWYASFQYVDENVIRAHPLIIDVLMENTEPVWSLEEILGKGAVEGIKSP